MITSMDDTAKKMLEGFSALLAKKSNVEINILRVETLWVSGSMLLHLRAQ